MDFSLDTNACIALLSGRRGAVLRNLLYWQAQGSSVYVSSLVIFELQYGIEKSNRPAESRRRIERLLSLGIGWLDFEPVEAMAAARIRADLNRRKQSIGPYDTLLAGHAVGRGLTLITANVREFARVDGLRWADWSVVDLHTS